MLNAVLKGSAPTADVSTGLNAQQIPTTVVVMTVKDFTTTQATQALGLYGNTPSIKNIKNAFQFYYPNAVQSNTELFYNALMVASKQHTTTIAATAQCADIVTYFNTIAREYQDSTEKNNVFIQANAENVAIVDQCLPDILTTLETNTSSKFLLVLQGAVDQTATLQQLTDDPVPAKVPRADGQVGPQYVTSGTLVALFTVFILLGFAFFGFGKIMDVEGPLRYPLTTPPNAREY